MSENTDKEYLESPPNTHSEKIPDDIASNKDTNTIIQNQETKNMEVHHHAHNPAEPHHKKNWKSYFWEFLMLFLAVFCGFLAEIYHTHIVNKDIEKRNIKSYINNIENDRIRLIESIHFCEEKIKLTDSLVNLKGEFSDSIFEKKYFYYALKLIYTDFYYPDESTFLQMQSSNTLRLVDKPNVIDSILSYHQNNIKLINQKHFVEKYFDLAFDNLAQIADFRNISNLNLNKNYQQLQNYLNYKVAENSSTRNYLENFLKPQLRSASKLIPFLKKEYGIK